jgi:hypothetical protein
MAEGGAIAGSIAVLVGLISFWRARSIGEFIGNFQNDDHNEFAVRVVGLVFLGAGLYFILG